MGKLKDEVVTPIPENKAVYDRLFAEYKKLYAYFGKGENDVMKSLKKIENTSLSPEIETVAELASGQPVPTN